MSGKVFLRRTYTPGKIPTVLDLLEGELGVNVPDLNFYFSDGSAITQLNAAATIRTDSTHRFVSDAQITQFGALATTTSAGQVQIGTNLQVNAGIISLQNADSTHTGALTSTDWGTFNGKQDALGFTPVNKAGDTMTGALVLPGAPTGANEATTKTYVDDGLALKLNLTGGTLTGSLILASDPTANLEATTKQYVDSAINTIGGSYAAPVQNLTALAAIVSTAREDKQIRLVEDTGAIYRFDAQATDTADGVGVIIPGDVTAPDPGRWFKTQSATQNHNLLNGLQGGATNDYLHLTTTEKNGYDSHITDTTIHITSAQNTFLDSINASATEINYLVGVTSLIQTQLDGKQASLGYTPVNKAGDTMTGDLILNADPTNVLGAVTKQYADNLVLDCGTF